MTPQERAGLAESLKANPLFAVILDEMEASAVERMIYAASDIDRLHSQLRVQAVIEFRRICRDALRPVVEPRKAPV